jgi:hypothetical protein
MSSSIGAVCFWVQQMIVPQNIQEIGEQKRFVLLSSVSFVFRTITGNVLVQSIQMFVDVLYLRRFVIGIFASPRLSVECTRM